MKRLSILIFCTMLFGCAPVGGFMRRIVPDFFTMNSPDEAHRLLQEDAPTIPLPVEDVEIRSYEEKRTFSIKIVPEGEVPEDIIAAIQRALEQDIIFEEPVNPDKATLVDEGGYIPDSEPITDPEQNVHKANRDQFLKILKYIPIPCVIGAIVLVFVLFGMSKDRLRKTDKIYESSIDSPYLTSSWRQSSSDSLLA